MIRGKVTPDCEAVVQLVVRGPAGRSRLIDAILDTGFNGYLTLPASLISDLTLPYHSPTIGMLADGTRVILSKYQASVLWGAREQDVIVLEADGGPLVGMAMLRGQRVALDVVPDGPVPIEPLPGSDQTNVNR